MIKIVDTTLRDGHQSLIATRMRTEDMLPILEDLDNMGFYSLEVWGGATYDTCLRYLAEDPWDRLRKIKEKVKHTPLQMLLRGQNLVAYRHFADDVVEKFVKLCVKNGIGVIRIFDALNDIRNMEVPIKVAKEAGAVVQGTISYTTSPVHTVMRFTEMAIKLAELGSDVICIKDMAGLITPQAAFELVSSIKKATGLQVDLHTHMTSGMGMLSYYAACEAGVDIVDCAFSPFANGTSQPPMESFVASLKNTRYDTGLDLEKLVNIGYYFLKVRQKYEALFSPVAEKSDVSVLLHQIPGGMISNLYSQLKEQKATDKYNQVLKEVPKVREDLGYPPLVTPTSQIVGTQAVLNVLLGERYKKITEEVKNYCLGYYGASPVPIKKEILDIITNGQKIVNVRPADLLEPELELALKSAKEANIPIKSDEDLLSYIMFPQVAAKFLKGEAKEEEIPKISESKPAKKKIETDEFIVVVDNEEFKVKIKPAADDSGVKTKEISKPAKESIPKGALLSPMQGMVVSIKVNIGDTVKKGQAVVIIEAMKMQSSINAEIDGVVKEIFVFEGEIVDAGDILIVIE